MIDDSGYITIVGRDKDLIISGGFNIYPKEVEDAINDITDQKCGITPSIGEVVAVIVLENPHPSARRQSIMAILKEQLAKFKQPKAIKFVDAAA